MWPLPMRISRQMLSRMLLWPGFPVKSSLQLGGRNALSRDYRYEVCTLQCCHVQFLLSPWHTVSSRCGSSKGTHNGMEGFVECRDK